MTVNIPSKLMSAPTALIIAHFGLKNQLETIEEDR